MFPSSPSGGSARLRRWTVPLLLVGALVVSFPAVGSPATAGGHAAPMTPPSHPLAHAVTGSPLAPAPLPPITGTTGTFYQNASGFAVTPNANVSCGAFTFECYNQAQEPSLLPLANHNVSIAYSQVTKATGTCPGAGPNATGNTTLRVATSISSDNALTFGAARYFPLVCPFDQQLEPSFAISSTGTVFGTYVEGNATQSQVLGYAAPGMDYTARPSDALAFVNSTDNATTFSAPKAIANAGTANIARPALAAFGRTVYIAYENIVNGTGVLAGTAVAPIAVEIVYSADAGTTWHGPFPLPGLNASQYNNSFSPSITVTSGGTVAVSYATNRHCIAYCLAYNAEYGDDIVVATSSTNGTHWNGPYVVAHNTGNGESGYYNGNYNYGAAYLFEDAPLTAIAYNPVASTFDVVWVGAVNLTNDIYYDQWYSTQAFAATSSNAVVWTNTTLGHGLPNNENTFAVGYFNPGVAISPTGEEYASVGWYNGSGYPCGDSGATYYSDGYTQWITTSPDGIHFSDLISATVAEGTGGYANYLGFRSAVAFNATGAPLVGYALPSGYTFSPLYTLIGQLDVARPYAGPTVNFQGIAGNLAPSAFWQFSLDGNVFSGTQHSFNVTNVPASPQIVIIQGAPGLTPSGFWAAKGSVQSGPSATALLGSTTYWFNETQLYGFNFNVEPLDVSYFYLNIYNYSSSPPMSCYHYWQSGATYFYSGGNSFPWYFPAGTRFSIGPNGGPSSGADYYSYIGIYFFNGTGSGSFTGPGSTAPIVLNSPINETAWAQSDAVYNVSVHPIGVPATSTYSFDWDGGSHSAPGSSVALVSNVSMGAHWVTQATATSALAGWRYFGQPQGGNPIAIPDTPTVNLTFALVHVSAAPGTIAFHAVGLTTGSVWRMSFNGTQYSSATPWINVTAHPGDYPVASYPVVAADGSAGYAPKPFGPMLNVSTGGVYPVTFSPAYALTAEASAGGRISPAPSTSWLLPGTIVTYNATANPGYRFVGWSGTGNGSFSGTTATASVTVNGAIVESAAFAPLPGNRFNLTFTQTTLPSGVWWTVYVGGVGYSSDTSSLTVTGLNACSQTHYALAVPYTYANGSNLARYAPVAPPAIVCAGAPVALSFAAQYFVTLETTAGGSVTVTTVSNTYTASFWLAASDSATFQATPSSAAYDFLGWNGSGPGSFSGAANPKTTSVGGPVTELAVFAPASARVIPHYHVTFVPTTTFATGTVWSVWFGGTTYSSSGPTLNVPNLLAGPYNVVVAGALSPDGLTQYQPVGAPSHLTVSANVSALNLTYRTSFWVAVSAQGGGTATPRTGWYVSGTTVALAAVADGSNVFKGWTGTGSGSYNGAEPFTNITVSGPITEVASFAPPAPASTTITSAWSSPTLWGGLAIAGLVVGLIVGIVAMRMRRGGSPPMAPAESTSPESAPPSSTYDEGGSA